MREILFRGKTYDDEWVEGNLFIPDKKDTPTQICIGTNIVRISYDVIPETVGQYTGLTDKNGTKIFEGDILRVTDDNGETNLCSCGVGYVLFYYGVWYICDEVNDGLYDVNNIYYIEVIGNIHDNPELLKGGAE